MSDIFAAVLPELTAFSESSMPDSFVVFQAGAFASDGAGGGTYANNTTRGPYAARKRRAGDREEQELGGQFQVIGSEVMSFALGTALAASESINYTLASTGQSSTYEVLYVAPRGSYSAHERALIRKAT